VSESTRGRLLVASPTLLEATFHRTVVLMLEHNPDDGAVGVVLNRASAMPVEEPLPAWHSLAAEPPVVFHGGPVDVSRVMCLAAGDDPGGAKYRRYFDGIGTLDLKRSADDVVGVTGIRVFVGHAAWAPEQLDDEIARRAWVVVDCEPGDVFTSNPADLWADVLARQPGIVALLSTYPSDVNLN
jgi:putative transcriptional regulator